MKDRSRPDLVFGASTGAVGRNGVRWQEERSLREFAPFCKLRGDRFNVSFDKTHGTDKDGAVRQQVEENGKSDAVFLDEICRFLSPVLTDSNDCDVRRLVALIETLKKWKRELANRASDFEEGEKDGTFLKCRAERKFFTVQGFERKVGRSVAGDDMGHRLPGSEEIRESLQEIHNLYFSGFSSESEVASEFVKRTHKLERGVAAPLWLL